VSARGAAFLSALALVAIGSGFLTGYPEVGAGSAIALAAVAALVTIHDLARRAPPGVHPPRRAAGSRAPDQLRRVDGALAAAQASAFGVDRELRPLLRPIAAMRLARRGVDLDRHVEKARALLGEPLWEIVRADRPRASNRVAGGISAVELEGAIERLEQL
jgi:hypothetical protein